MKEQTTEWEKFFASYYQIQINIQNVKITPRINTKRTNNSINK
jgi:hypothetical protein